MNQRIRTNEHTIRNNCIPKKCDQGKAQDCRTTGNSTMNHGSLFSGIGGFDLAAHWMGWNNVFHCDINPFSRKVLGFYWPQADSLEDITQTCFKKYHGTVDIVTGGFPCQPFSTAGKRKGTEDDRHLWPEMLRAIREIRPRYIVGENVAGLLSWDEGVVFQMVCSDLEAEGYTVQALDIPAGAVGAPHRRHRVWFVAYSESSGITKQHGSAQARQQVQAQRHADGQDGNGPVAYTHGSGYNRPEEPRAHEVTAGTGDAYNTSNGGGRRPTTNPNGQRLEGGMHKDGQERTVPRHNASALRTRATRQAWQGFPTESPVCGHNDGLPTELDGITLSKWRKESIAGYGNAVVPQIPFLIFQFIEQHSRQQ